MEAAGALVGAVAGPGSSGAGIGDGAVAGAGAEGFDPPSQPIKVAPASTIAHAHERINKFVLRLPHQQ